MYSKEFERAINHAMLYEVGGFWQLTPEVEAGLIGTRAQRRAVGYVNDPLDAGGETKFGVAKNANPEVNIASLTWAGAKDIYYRKYWLAGKCDLMPPRIAIMHFDGCVNHGVKNAAKFLQRAVGADDDGLIGPATLARLQQFDEVTVCRNIGQQRVSFYKNIVANRPNQSRFLDGWLRRVNEVVEYVATA